MANAGAGTAGQPGHWSASIAMNMPALGELRARISLAGSRVSFRIEGTEEAGQVLAAERGALASALSARGLLAADIQFVPGGARS
jgi:hypothetical protein